MPTSNWITFGPFQSSAPQSNDRCPIMGRFREGPRQWDDWGGSWFTVTAQFNRPVGRSAATAAADAIYRRTVTADYDCSGELFGGVSHRGIRSNRSGTRWTFTVRYNIDV